MCRERAHDGDPETRDAALGGLATRPGRSVLKPHDQTTNQHACAPLRQVPQAPPDGIAHHKVHEHALAKRQPRLSNHARARLTRLHLRMGRIRDGAGSQYTQTCRGWHAAQCIQTQLQECMRPRWLATDPPQSDDSASTSLPQPLQSHACACSKIATTESRMRSCFSASEHVSRNNCFSLLATAMASSICEAEMDGWRMGCSFDAPGASAAILSTPTLYVGYPPPCPST